METEVAFNLGFEAGLVAGCTHLPSRRRSKTNRAETVFQERLLRTVAGAALPAEVAASIVIDFGVALVRRDITDRSGAFVVRDTVGGSRGAIATRRRL